MNENQQLLNLLSELKSDLLEKLKEINGLQMSQKNLQIISSLNSELSLHINTLKNENK